MWPGTLGPSVKRPMGPRSVGEVCRNGCGGRMRTVALGPWVELPVGPRNVWVVSRYVGDACWQCH
eukprot:6718381-Pyramimonas_sp.AAC.1